MLIEGSLASKKTNFLIEKYTELLKKGVSSSDILVLCQNPLRKSEFIKKIKEDKDVNYLEKINIHTFAGLCYNSILDNFCLIENALDGKKFFLTPNLCGLEVSGYIFKKAIENADFRDYNSKVNLMHQLFKRHSLIVQNNLSPKEIIERSKILNESFAPDAEKALKEFAITTNELRSYDYLRQISLFKYLWQNYNIFENIKYLIVDDADEMPPIVIDFIEHLSPTLKDFYIAYDPLGSSRCGYLSACTNIKEQLFKIFKTTPIILNENKNKNIDIFEKNKKIKLSYTATSKYLDQLDCIFEKIDNLLARGISAGDIALVTPNFNEMLKFYCKEKFEQLNIKYKFLCGTQKLNEDIIVKNILLLLKLKNTEWNLSCDIFEIKNFFCNFLEMPLKLWREIATNYEEKNEFFISKNLETSYGKKFEIIKNFINETNSKKQSLSEKITIAAKTVLSIFTEELELEKFNFFYKQIQDFEIAFPEKIYDEKFQSDIILQIQNSIISENPPAQEFFSEYERNTILIGTPQKIIDVGKKINNLFLLDTTSDTWKKQDIGMLYNAWVFSRNWEGKTFELEDNINFTKNKIERCLRKLLLISEKVFAFSSIFDDYGNENTEGISNYFEKEKITETLQTKKFEPRRDQKAVLDYKNGHLAIAAVPGAGKTTILLALIIKLHEQNIKPENIFVLTYMDSAARNFKDRIKSSLKTLKELPNISTIHGLALRIIKENSNYSRIGLNEDFEIIDDLAKQRLINGIFSKFQINQENYDKWERAISSLKLSSSQKQSFNILELDTHTTNFINFVKYYNSILLRNNKIDYDDMLRFALQILEENEDILKHYQEICHIIIEDEAQDSSYVQQRLLELLSGKHHNLIRCGDINQAITSTFANADVEGFKNFIAQNNKVEMKTSQRCAKEIYSLANNFVEFAKNTPDLKNAFFDIKMEGVEGKNPESTNAVEYYKFKNNTEEKEFITQRIKTTFKQTPNATIGILLRNNYQVENYISYLQANDICAITTGETLAQKRIFKIVYYLFQLSTNPFNNKICDEIAHLIYPNEKFEILKNFKEEAFLSKNPDTFKNYTEIKLWWDLTYWINKSFLPANEFALKIGTYYAETPIELSNVYLLAGLISKIKNSSKSFKELMEKLSDISKRTNYGGIKFFDEKFADEGLSPDNQISQKVRVMTIHKSKGDEFDVVFMPEFSENMLPLSMENLKVKSDTIFIEKIKSLTNSCPQKSHEELTREQLSENARLLYVAITRAKKKLIFSMAKGKESTFCKHFFEIEGYKND